MSAPYTWMLTETAPGLAFDTRWMSPTLGDTMSMAPAGRWWEPRAASGPPAEAGANSSHRSAPRSTPTMPQTVWSCTGVAWPGPHTKLTTEKRSSGSQWSRYC